MLVSQGRLGDGSTRITAEPMRSLRCWTQEWLSLQVLGLERGGLVQIQPGFVCLSLEQLVEKADTSTALFCFCCWTSFSFRSAAFRCFGSLLHWTVTFLTCAQLLGESDRSLKSLLCPPSLQVIWSRHKTKPLVAGSQLGSSRMARTPSWENVWGKPENKEFLLRV